MVWCVYGVCVVRVCGVWVCEGGVQYVCSCECVCSCVCVHVCVWEEFVSIHIHCYQERQ